ncbi:response regulator [Streptomyces avermitilis]|uniref:response regulator n=1 Tax=Streptomyces avermitilis TaxID=33903 RepID=UPI0033D6CCA3
MSGTPGPRNGRVRVLIVDDEPGLTELLSVAVTEAGRRPYPAADGHSALRRVRGCAPHAVVLDGMLPDLDGLQVLRRLRYESPRLPVLMLTARDALERRIEGLAMGVDDYVTKPFSLEEVVLRLRGLYVSHLRRKIDKGRPPMIRTVRGLGYAIRSAEDGR